MDYTPFLSCITSSHTARAPLGEVTGLVNPVQLGQALSTLFFCSTKGLPTLSICELILSGPRQPARERLRPKHKRDKIHELKC